MLGCLGKGINLVDSKPSTHELLPSLLGLHPDVEVGMDAHHEGTDGPTGLEQQDPGSVEEEEYTKDELDTGSERFNVVHVVIQRFPHRGPVRVHHEQGINEQANDNLDHDLDTEGGHGQQPG